MSNVFRQIKSTDVYQRPFKAYKHYRLNHPGVQEAYVTHSGVYYGGRIDQDGTITYPTNDDGTNAHVAWYAIKQKFYDDDLGAIPEHVLNPYSERSLFQSASSVTIPYNDVGERIKNESFVVTSSIGEHTIILKDDGDGNLIDLAIPSSSFATGSFFYLSLNKTFTKFRDLIELSATSGTTGNEHTGSLTYELKGVPREATVVSGSTITKGVQMVTGSHKNIPDLYAGLGIRLKRNEHIQIPHDSKFDRFGNCDDWTISFWTEVGPNNHGDQIAITRNLLSKHYIKQEFVTTPGTYANSISRGSFTTRLTKFPNRGVATSSALFDNIRTPFNLAVKESGSLQTFFFHSSNGSKAMMISGSITKDIYSHHVLIRNSASICEMFLDGVKSTDSGSLPEGVVANDNDIVIGDFPAVDVTANHYTTSNKFAEFRMYDYAASTSQIANLSNNHYVSGSLFQTDIVGNIFHRNGTAVVSSPMPKYHSGSGIFSADYTWNAKWRGTHTIYENEAFVRVPQDILNVTMNPSSTYKPTTDNGKPCSPNQVNTLPGEMRKDLFISGTLKPYVTTIGLYNKDYELLAVGKLAQPIQKRDDVDMNFVVRWDY